MLDAVAVEPEVLYGVDRAPLCFVLKDVGAHLVSELPRLLELRVRGAPPIHRAPSRVNRTGGLSDGHSLGKPREKGRLQSLEICLFYPVSRVSFWAAAPTQSTHADNRIVTLSASRQYEGFKIFARGAEGTTDELVADVYHHAKHWVKLAFGRSEDVQLRAAIGDISQLKVNVAYPFLMEVLDDIRPQTR
jgi:hypothetical protein